MATLPTTLRGTMDDSTYGAWLADALEHVPDLAYPLSIQQYAVMRRDPTLAAILAGYTLQVRRASWAVDGTGCRPEVVKLVADDLGLPVAGQDTPGAARLRGVSWEEHLRTALLCLTYGHMAFELLAEVRDGTARLVTLAERMPHTISELHVDPGSGALLGISQEMRHDKRPQIGADRLCFYSWEREGASWQGTSLLRPAYGVHLLKREVQRVVATGVRRFSMGVPVVEWAPGTVPTPQQMLEAQQVASAARVGDQSGAAMPPGAMLKLVGLTGGAPDGLGLLQWLDRQQSRMALMGHLELGQGDSSGSRALGTAFIDNLMLALETLGSFVASQVTRQVAARIVEWNWGLGEPVPLVTVSGIGSRREVTAESLELLLRSGALSADPGLEAWIRREFRLPERETPPPVVAPNAAPPVVASRPKARRRREAAGQLALPVMAAAPSREPTEVEQAAGVDFEALQAEFEAARAELAEQWPEESEPLVEALVAAVVATLAAGAVAELGSLVVDAAVIAGLAVPIAASMTTLAVLSAGRAADELRSQGADVEAGTPDTERLAEVAQATAGLIAGGYASGAARVALIAAGPDADPDAVGEQVRAHLVELSQVNDAGPGGWVSTNLGGALTTAQNAGRAATFEQAPTGTRWVASESLDPNTCDPCAEADGKSFDSLADALEVYPSGGNRSCQGGQRCRGLLVAVIPN